MVYRLGFADSRNQARQLVNHAHFNVNGRRVDIPSYLVKENDQITVRENSRNTAYFKSLESLGERTVSEWLRLDAANLTGHVVRLPKREDIDIPVAEHLIVEKYSR